MSTENVIIKKDDQKYVLIVGPPYDFWFEKGDDIYDEIYGEYILKGSNLDCAD